MDLTWTHARAPISYAIATGQSICITRLCLGINHLVCWWPVFLISIEYAAMCCVASSFSSCLWFILFSMRNSLFQAWRIMLSAESTLNYIRFELCNQCKCSPANHTYKIKSRMPKDSNSWCFQAEQIAGCGACALNHFHLLAAHNLSYSNAFTPYKRLLLSALFP